MTVLATVIVLGVLIFVHELGHFGAAKLVGIEVQRFSIGLGPKIVGFTVGETEYVLSAIPLGGYVKMGGMDDEVMDRVEGGAVAEPRQPSHRDFDQKPIWARTLVISAGVIMNMLFAFATYAFVAAQWGIPDYATTRIGQVEAAGLPAGAEALATVEPGSRIVRLAGEPVDDWGAVMDGLLDAPEGPLTVELQPTDDILRGTVEARPRHMVAVGFALEWGEGEARAREKLKDKVLDFIVLNRADEAGAGFASETNRVTLLDGETAVPLERASKAEVAERILDAVETRL